jgi:hypothetical protein
MAVTGIAHKRTFLHKLRPIDPLADFLVIMERGLACERAMEPRSEPLVALGVLAA